MVIVDKPAAAIGFTVRRRIGQQGQYGALLYGQAEYGHGDPRHGVYQMRRGKERQIVVQEKFYEPSDQSQPNKVARQVIFDAAVAAWQGLTAEQKLPYDVRATRLKMSGYNLFLKEYLLSN